MRPSLRDSLLQDAATSAAAGLFRKTTTFSTSGPTLLAPSDAAGLLDFCSNDYLGLARDPRLAHAARAATDPGFGAAASRLVTGTRPPHEALEAALAAFFARESALLFPTGYQTNLGVITALAGPDDLLVSDSANHASLIDGCRLSRAKIAIYPHRDVDAADALLRAHGQTRRRRFLVTESLFSMDGDFAPLRDLAAICERHDAALIVDEAHAVGVLGPHGQGLCAAAAVRPDVLIGTLGKAFGGFGGFALGDAPLRTALVNRARTFIFTTAPPPLLAEAALAALRIIDSPEGDQRRATLQNHLFRFATHVPVSAKPGPVLSPIIPIILGANEEALNAAAHLRDAGFLVSAIRPPTVPQGTARLRVTLSAAHQEAHIDQLGRIVSSLDIVPLP